MGWLTQPLPAGGTWTDSVTGRTWTISGSGLELWQTYQPEFSYQFAAWNPVSNLWGNFTDPGTFSPELFSFSGTRQVVDWWRGPRAMNLNVRFLASESPGPDVGLGELLRIQVKVGTPSGGENTRTLFEGVISERKVSLGPDNIPLISCLVLDDMGTNSQAAFDPSVNFASAPSGNMISGIYTNWMNTRFPLVLAGPDLGVTGTFNSGSGTNVLAEIATLMRGELGILWPSRDGRTVYNSGDWYVARGTPSAIIGTNLGAVTGTWNLPIATSQPVSTIRNVYNETKWTGPAPQGSAGASQLNTVPQYGRRVWSDNTYVDTNINQSSNVARLASVLGSTPRERVEQASFPADLSIDAMNYATFADPGDYVYVTKEWLPDKWNQQVEAHVMGVTHQWSQAQGWTCSLKLTEALIPYTFDTPGRVPG